MQGQPTPVLTAPLLVTFTGKKLDLFDPQAHLVDIRDIAHALANICRWGGHTAEFYSVAEHSILVSHVCSDPRWGLLHDATEAYLGDIVRPLKRFLPMYAQLEEAWTRSIATALGLPLSLPEDLKACDDTIALMEADQIMAPGAVRSQLGGQEDRMPPFILHAHKIRCFSPMSAEALFLARWEDIRHG